MTPIYDWYAAVYEALTPEDYELPPVEDDEEGDDCDDDLDAILYRFGGHEP